MTASTCQPAVLAQPSLLGRSLTYRVAPDANLRDVLLRFRQGFTPDMGVVGFGEPLVALLGGTVAGLRTFPALSGPGCNVPSSQQALWLMLRGDSPTALFDLSVRIEALLAGGFVLDQAMDTFLYAGGRDLTGYEDGTENPEGAGAASAALVATGDGLVGSTFAAVQRWVHDLPRFQSFPAEAQDAMLGRQRVSNKELGAAPPSAHVKRAAQESFSPDAFMVRRSMPWATAQARGLEFIAFGESLDRYERVLRRMLGLEDGIIDALFHFSRPITGGYYWCPPVRDGLLDLSVLGGL